jgi:hypothetical protein
MDWNACITTGTGPAETQLYSISDRPPNPPEIPLAIALLIVFVIGPWRRTNGFFDYDRDYEHDYECDNGRACRALPRGEPCPFPGYLLLCPFESVFPSDPHLP